MKRMLSYILIGVTGLGVCGWIVLRHAVRTAGPAPTSEGSGLPRPKAVDRWQEGIRVDTRTDYGSNPTARQRTEEKLRAEELRQKPWEGRN